MAKIISKAAAKRLKDSERRMRNILNRKLISFKNDYLGDFVELRKQLQRKIH